jgi:putative ABC transport system ATP-binding protein
MRNISKVFKSAAGEFAALNDVTTCFYRGEFVSVVGKSGSGKSTLVNMITGIDRPTHGTVCIDGVHIQELSESRMSAWRGRNLGIVFQFYQLLPMLSLLENVMLPMDLCDRYNAEAREARALELLALVELQDYADKLPAEISGGQQQSAAIARALANDPPILIADEPTGNLDSHTAAGVFDLFAGLMESGKTILMVTHDRSLAQRATRMLEIVDGRLAEDSEGCGA